MAKTVRAVFDGKALWPDEMIDLEPGAVVKLTIGGAGKKSRVCEVFPGYSSQSGTRWAHRLVGTVRRVSPPWRNARWQMSTFSARPS